jgi:hypothetical protein
MLLTNGKRKTENRKREMERLWFKAGESLPRENGKRKTENGKRKTERL